MFRYILRTLQSLAAVLCFAAFPLASQATIPDAVQSGSCSAATAYKYVTSIIVDQVSKHEFVPVRNLKITFDQGKKDCVMVALSAAAFASATSFMDVLVELDGDTDICSPYDNNFLGTGSATFSGSHAMNFICPDVAPGSHTVRILYRAFNGAVQMQNRTMIVHYIK